MVTRVLASRCFDLLLSLSALTDSLPSTLSLAVPTSSLSQYPQALFRRNDEPILDFSLLLLSNSPPLADDFWCLADSDCLRSREIIEIIIDQALAVHKIQLSEALAQFDPAWCSECTHEFNLHRPVIDEATEFFKTFIAVNLLITVYVADLPTQTTYMLTLIYKTYLYVNSMVSLLLRLVEQQHFLLSRVHPLYFSPCQLTPLCSKLFNFFAQIAQKFLLSNILDPSLTLLASTPQRIIESVQYFGLSTIIAATDNFSPINKLGQGGFGIHESLIVILIHYFRATCQMVRLLL
ncbi:unnamed protein product [Malus baccata var. baccata]